MKLYNTVATVAAALLLVSSTVQVHGVPIHDRSVGDIGASNDFDIPVFIREVGDIGGPDDIGEPGDIGGPGDIDDPIDDGDFPIDEIDDPIGGEPIGGDPIGGNPIGGDPIGGNPIGGNPIGGNPIGGDPGDAPGGGAPAPPDVDWEQIGKLISSLTTIVGGLIKNIPKQ